MSEAQSGPAFNPEVFLNLTTTEANSTELLAVPEGEYLAVSKPVTEKNLRSFDIKNGPRAGTKGLSLDLQWDINDDDGKLKEFLGRSPTARQGIMLDLREDGALEFGKGRNVNLGLLREALGQNMTGRPWSFSMLGSQVARIKVKHRIVDGQTFSEVSAVTKA